MPPDKLAIYTGHLIGHPEYAPTFSTRLGSAIEWSKQHPEKFNAMVAEFDAALDFLNSFNTPIYTSAFQNITAYRQHRRDILPRVGGQDTHSAPDILAAARDSGNKLRWGETIKQEGGDFYGYHNYVKSDPGMAAASLTDLYENYTHVIGLYPDGTDIDGFLANAITEATYLTNPEGELFQAYKIPTDEWIYKYPGFSPQFQELVYGD